MHLRLNVDLEMFTQVVEGQLLLKCSQMKSKYNMKGTYNTMFISLVAKLIFITVFNWNAWGGITA